MLPRGKTEWAINLVGFSLVWTAAFAGSVYVAVLIAMAFAISLMVYRRKNPSG